MKKSEALIRIHDSDNVAVALKDLAAGESAALDGVEIVVRETLERGHKVAVQEIRAGQNVVKYGFPIGHASADIRAGEFVHTHNVQTNLKGKLDYAFHPHDAALKAEAPATFQGFLRPDGTVGIRNEIWIINTVGCVNKTAEILMREANQRWGTLVDGIFSFSHPFGCSQIGDDHRTTQGILADLVKHPNASGVLVLGLGCENNNIGEFRKVLGPYDEQRVRFLSIQDVGDEISEGLLLIEQLVNTASRLERQAIPASRLVVGLKCGGSDGFSGITANPLLGSFSDRLTAQGGSSILTEVPEMFGAETILMDRCRNAEVFDKTVDLINNFKEYFSSHNQVIYENPSPGNKKGGITTLEEKSLGCIQKGGAGPVIDVLDYGEQVKTPGLNLLQGPGNDAVSVTALTAAGAHLVLFTTGRGNPLGGPVPTVKISSNSDLAMRKKEWIDFNAGQLLDGREMTEVSGAFFEYVLQVASGQKTCNERNGYREISIFKDGVTL